ncbi:Mucolipin-3 [Halotydeus destructor]|nr:Mucolipin-3 [Halotydeus destructor]
METSGAYMTSQETNFTNSYSPNERDKFRRRLKYYFMNPIDKWRAKGRLPWKLGLQVIKIIVVTLQLLIFGLDMSKYLVHQGNMIVSFREIFLSDWDTVREVMSYPPAAGPYAVYRRQELYEHMNYAIIAYSQITSSAIGTFGYAKNISSENPMSAIEFCKDHYKLGIVDPTTYFYNYTNKVEHECIDVYNETLMPNDPTWQDFDMEDYLEYHNFSLIFSKLLQVTLKIPLRTIYLNSLDPSNKPECYDTDVKITYDNTQHDGQIVISLTADGYKHSCNGALNHASDYKRTHELVALNVLVISLCTISCLLCLRSLVKGQYLRSATTKFFQNNFGRELSYEDQLEFIDFWLVMMVVNDVFIISGSVLKIQLEQRVMEPKHYNICSLLLGVGNLLVWCGLLRYLGFFSKYNVLILTLRRSFPHVCRFMLCTLLMYSGFCFCGWVILGPYHVKFKTLSRTSECLFALLNGDDMFATFAITEGDDTIWWFSRIYLYLFIALFIYVVLSLFIAIIMDSYDTIKEFYEQGFPLSDMKRFIAECPDDPTSSIYLSDAEADEDLRSVFSRYFGRIANRRATYQRID